MNYTLYDLMMKPSNWSLPIMIQRTQLLFINNIKYLNKLIISFSVKNKKCIDSFPFYYSYVSSAYV